MVIVSSVLINEEIMRCSTWHQVLDHAVLRSEVMDEVNAVTALHRAAKLYREEESSTPVEVVQASDGLHRLLELVWHLSRRCKPQQLSNAVWSCAVLLWQDAPILTRLADLAVERLGGFTTQNVANTIWAHAVLGMRHEHFLSLVLVYVRANVKDFTPQDLANTCWAHAKLQRHSDELFQHIVTESLVRLDTFQAQNMSNLVWACATVLFKDASSMDYLARHASGRVEEFLPQELSNLTWGMATLNLFCEPWLEASGLEMAKRTEECCPQDLSNTLWAYGTLIFKRKEILRALNKEVIRQIDQFSPQGLGNTAWGLSAVDYRDQMALTCICEEVMRRPLDQMTPPDISTLFYSFAVLSWVHEGAFEKLRRAVRYVLPVMESRDVANVSWAMVTLSHRDDGLFKLLIDKAAEVMSDFTITGLCNVAWAFVRMGLEVPATTALTLASETLSRREDLLEGEPGDCILLSDAVCSEWADSVPRSVFDDCDALGRVVYDRVFVFLADLNNVPSLGAGPGEVEQYQRSIIGFRTVQLGSRLSEEFLRRLHLHEECSGSRAALRAAREEWLLEALERVEPHDGTWHHKTTCAWSLDTVVGSGGVRVLASGTPMNEPIRFVSCCVEHSRSNDAEFQVLNKAAEELLSVPQPPTGLLRIDVSEIPCMSCLGALRQFQKAFPAVQIRLSFSIRKVFDTCSDRSSDAPLQLDLPPPRRHVDVLPSSSDNRGRSGAVQPVRRPTSQPPRGSMKAFRSVVPVVSSSLSSRSEVADELRTVRSRAVVNEVRPPENRLDSSREAPLLARHMGATASGAVALQRDTSESMSSREDGMPAVLSSAHSVRGADDVISSVPEMSGQLQTLAAPLFEGTSRESVKQDVATNPAEDAAIYCTLMPRGEKRQSFY